MAALNQARKGVEVLTPLCAPVPGPAVPPVGDGYDAGYELILDDTGTYRVLADRLRTAADRIGSLIREANAAIPDLRSIIFDAREVRLQDPLTFTSAHLVFRANRLIIESGGEIRLTGQPRELNPQADDGVTLRVRKLVFAEAAVPLPFAFVLGTYASGRRRLDATLEELVDRGRSLTNKEDIAAALRNRLLPPQPNHDIEIAAGLHWHRKIRVK